MVELPVAGLLGVGQIEEPGRLLARLEKRQIPDQLQDPQAQLLEGVAQIVGLAQDGQGLGGPAGEGGGRRPVDQILVDEAQGGVDGGLGDHPAGGDDMIHEAEGVA